MISVADMVAAVRRRNPLFTTLPTMSLRLFRPML